MIKPKSGDGNEKIHVKAWSKNDFQIDAAYPLHHGLPWCSFLVRRQRLESHFKAEHITLIYHDPLPFFG